MNFSHSPQIRRGAEGGFALVISLTIMAFLVVLGLALASLASIENKTSKVQVDMLAAKQNARVGLMVALGELQAVAGADQRSMARAELMSQHSSVAIDAADIPNNVGDARRYWVGVSHSDGSSGIGPNNQAVHWLVSGLDRTADSADQLTEPLTNPVVLIDDGSAESGNFLSAGKLPITKGDTEIGAYAWLVDDETQKAKLAPENPEVNNESPSTLLSEQRSNLPGYFDLSATTGLTTSLSNLSRASTLQELAIGQSANEPLARQRFYDYTLSGYGLLTDTRSGGLKRDLTAAFENPSVFDDLFPDTSETPYIAMDPDKFDESKADELRSNGYIHHGIFRDYYNLKDRLVDGSLRMTVFGNELINDLGTDDTQLGNVGPHNFNRQGHPYGTFDTWDGDGTTTTDGSHNPITPVLAYLQQNAWIEAQAAHNGEQDPLFDSKTQVWAGVYNPFNVAITMSSRGTAGPVFRGYPQSRIYALDGDDQSLIG